MGMLPTDECENGGLEARPVPRRPCGPPPEGGQEPRAAQFAARSRLRPPTGGLLRSEGIAGEETHQAEVGCAPRTIILHIDARPRATASRFGVRKPCLRLREAMLPATRRKDRPGKAAAWLPHSKGPTENDTPERGCAPSWKLMVNGTEHLGDSYAVISCAPCVGAPCGCAAANAFGIRERPRVGGSANLPVEPDGQA